MKIYNNTVTHAGGGICVEPYFIQAAPMLLSSGKQDKEQLKATEDHLHTHLQQ